VSSGGVGYEPVATLRHNFAGGRSSHNRATSARADISVTLL